MLPAQSEPMDVDSNYDMHWSCPKCTFSNKSHFTFCEICGEPTTILPYHNNFGFEDFAFAEDEDQVLARVMFESMQDINPSTPPPTTPPLSPRLRRPMSYSFGGDFDENTSGDLPLRNSFFDLRNNIHSHDGVVSKIWDFADDRDFRRISRLRSSPLKRRYSITKRFEQAHTISFYGSKNPEELTPRRLSKLKCHDPVVASKFVSKFQQMSQEAKVIMLTGYADVSATQERVIADRMEIFIRDGNVVILDKKSSYICGSPLRELYKKGRKVTKVFSHPEFEGYDDALEFRRMGKGCLIRSEKNFAYHRTGMWNSLLNFAVDFLALSPVSDFVEILEERKWPVDLIAITLEYMFGLTQTEFTDLKEENAFFGTFCPIILLE